MWLIGFWSWTSDADAPPVVPAEFNYVLYRRKRR